LWQHISINRSAFNRRDVDGALALMSETVDWPKALAGGRVVILDQLDKITHK
jgi:hypothetical protein